MIESSIIRILSESGRLLGQIKRKEWDCIGRRFDWFVKSREGTIKEESISNLKKFFIWVCLVSIFYHFVIAKILT